MEHTVGKNNVGNGSEAVDEARLASGLCQTITRSLDSDTDHRDHHGAEDTDERCIDVSSSSKGNGSTGSRTDEREPRNVFHSSWEREDQREDQAHHSKNN